MHSVRSATRQRPLAYECLERLNAVGAKLHFVPKARLDEKPELDRPARRVNLRAELAALNLEMTLYGIAPALVHAIAGFLPFPRHVLDLTPRRALGARDEPLCGRLEIEIRERTHHDL